MTSFYSNISWFLVFCSFSCLSQTSGLWDSEIALNTKLNSRWSLNANIGNRNLLTTYLGSEAFHFTARHIQAGINTAYEIGLYTKLGGGMMYRWNTLGDSDAENELRTTQQFSMARHYNALRIVHRWKADQRFKGSQLEHRLRYRFSTDFPLQGLSLDVNELYLLFSTESIFNFGKDINPMWDQRLNTGLGFQLSKPIKLQLSLQYRWEDYIGATNHRMFVNTQLFYSL